MLILFALLDLFTALVVVFEHYLPWRILFVAAMSLATKALIFNDTFLSIFDALSALYIVLLIFITKGVMGWIVAGYLFYKAAVSI